MPPAYDLHTFSQSFPFGFLLKTSRRPAPSLPLSLPLSAFPLAFSHCPRASTSSIPISFLSLPSHTLYVSLALSLSVSLSLSLCLCPSPYDLLPSSLFTGMSIGSVS